MYTKIKKVSRTKASISNSRSNIEKELYSLMLIN